MILLTPILSQSKLKIMAILQYESLDMDWITFQDYLSIKLTPKIFTVIIICRVLRYFIYKLAKPTFYNIN